MVLDEILTPDAVAAALACSEHRLAILRMKGDGPPFFKLRGLVRYPGAQLRAWLESQMRTQTDGGRTGKAGRKPGPRAA
jgi:hypothetical protein